MDRRWALIAVTLIVVVIAVAVGINAVLPGGNSSPSPSPTDLSPYDEIRAQIGPNGEVTKEMALEAFSLAIAPLPGVTVPTGAPPNLDEQGDATFAFMWIMRYRDQLTPDQRAVVDPYFRPDPSAPQLTPAAGNVYAPDIVLAADTTASDYLDLAEMYESQIAARLGRQLSTSISMRIDTSQVAQHENWLAYSIPVNSDWSECAIHVEPLLQSGGDAAMKNATMAHEVFHCFQFDWARKRGFLIQNAPDWITEGQAEWAGETLGGPSKTGTDWWRTYLTSPDTALFGRDYDAVGFYQHMAEEGIDPWTHFDSMLAGYAQASHSVDAYLAASVDDDTFLDTWASGNFNDPALGDVWNAMGPWDVSVKPTRDKITIDNGTVAHPTVDPLTNGLVEATVNADILQVESAGHVRMRAPPVPDLPATNRWLCYDPNQCKCPPGQTYEGPQLEYVTPNPAGATADFGLTGGLEGANLALSGHDLDEYCKPQPSQLPSGCQDCGHSNGDPHLRTINRYRYDFQGAGEFVLLRNTDSTIEVQARQEPYKGELTAFHAVSINAAIALRTGGHTVSVYATPDGPVLHEDGAAIDPVSLPNLGAGGAVKAVSGGFEIDLADGSIVWALGLAEWGINVVVQPSDGLLASGMGLLGPITPGGMGVPALPDGTQLPAAPDFDTRHAILYGQFADAWRVTDGTTLFDYDAGKSTATYTDRNFPSDADDAALAAAMASPDPASQATADSACAGLTDEDLHAECEFDVLATDDVGFAQQYRAEQDLYDNGIAAASPTPPANGAPTGVQKVIELQDLVGATIGPDDTLYVSMDTSSGANELLAVDPTTAAIKQQVQMTVATSLHFAAGSVWAAGQTTDANGQHCSVTRYDPLTLAKQGDYEIPCASTAGATPHLTSMGDAVWFVDTGHTDPNTGAGTALTQIDPGTNAPGRSVALGYAGGCCQDSQGAVFCSCGQSDIWRLTSTDSGFVDLGSYGSIFPAGSGFWSEQDQSAVFVDGATGPSVVLPMTGNVMIDRVVGGDPTGVYFEGQPPDVQLSRQPADGSALIGLAKAPVSGTGIDQTNYDYLSGAFPWFATPRGYLHLWMFKETPDSPLALWVQWAQLP